jgi:uncharacterized protein
VRKRAASLIEVQVFGLLVDEETRTPVVVLRAVEGEETLPIRVGFPEAGAIAAVLEEVELPRPLTHDLLMSLVNALDGKVVKAEVLDLRDDTYFAVLHVRHGRRIHRFDARPSDAIALCLRAHAPLFVSEEVFRKAAPRDAVEASRQQWLGFLHSLEAAADPSAIGRDDNPDEKTVQ